MNFLAFINFVAILIILCNHSSQQKHDVTSKTVPFYKQQKWFNIDYAKDTYIKDGQPIQLITATIHYYRAPPSEWEDRMLKAKLGGMNTIQTYIEWASHEIQDNQFDFSTLNITEFCLIAQKLGLNVILRLGPFIASERDGMGFPYWLAAKNPNMIVRSSDESFKFYVKRWYDVLLPILAPLTYENGGPIIMAAVENEYGSYVSYYKQCPDGKYLAWLRDLFRSYFGPNFLLITVDGCEKDLLQKGHIDSVYSTVDFMPSEDPVECFRRQREVEPHGPLVNSEYYPGWFDCWGDPHEARKDFTIYNVTKTLTTMLLKNASMTFYPFYGGTSFGFMNGMFGGQFGNDSYLPMTTSYDFLAPVDDLGRLTPKYWSIRHAIQKYAPNSSPYNSLNDSQVLDKLRTLSNSASNSGLPEGQVNIPLVATFHSNIFDVIKKLTPIVSQFPQTFEQLTVRHGFVLYQTIVPFYALDNITLDCSNCHDRAHVFLNHVYRGVISQRDRITSLELDWVTDGSLLQLLVENQGHPCCGPAPGRLDQKGIVGNITFANFTLTNWTHYKVFSSWDEVISNQSVLGTSVEQLATNLVANSAQTEESCGCDVVDKHRIPSFYTAQFSLSKLPVNEVVLNVGSCGFKGVAFMNGFNLGRYWPVKGPQVTLYIPRATLSTSAPNTLVLLELDRNQRQCLSVSITDRHILDGKVTNYI